MTSSISSLVKIWKIRHWLFSSNLHRRFLRWQMAQKYVKCAGKRQVFCEFYRIFEEIARNIFAVPDKRFSLVGHPTF